MLFVHVQCSPAEFVSLAQGFQAVCSTLIACSDMARLDIQSALLREVFTKVGMEAYDQIEDLSSRPA